MLWPAIPLVVEEKFTGLAFGIGTAAYNAGCAVLPLVVAAIYTDAGSKYVLLLLLFVLERECLWGEKGMRGLSVLRHFSLLTHAHQ